MAFGIARFMPKSEQANYQDFTIWSCGKATLGRKIPKSLPWQSSIFKGLSPPTTKTIWKSQQRHLPPSIRLHQYLDLLSHQWLGLQRLRQRSMANVLSPIPLPSEQKSPKPLFCIIPLGFLPKKYLICRLGGFSPITLHRSFGFAPQYPTRIRRFFINWLLIY